MKDVARHAGVSVSAVSYVLNDTGHVGKTRRARILDAMQVLNYTPNDLARRLKRHSAATIGLILPELSNQFFASVAEGVEFTAAERGVLVVLCVPEAVDRPTGFYTQLLRSRRLDGVLYLPGSDGMALSLGLELAEAGPVVLVDERIPGFDVPAVIADSRRGARQCATYVLDQGHRRLAIIGGPESLWTVQQRLAGFREAIASHGMDPDAVPVFFGDHRLASGAAFAARALADSAATRPTALLCGNDLMAFGVLQYCKRAGLRVPEDVSITGFDDIPSAELVTPGLTTVRQPARDMGRQAAELLLELIDGTDPDRSVAPHPTELVIRDSVTGPSIP